MGMMYWTQFMSHPRSVHPPCLQIIKACPETMGIVTIAAVAISRDGKAMQQCHMAQRDCWVCPLAPLCPVWAAAFPGMAWRSPGTELGRQGELSPMKTTLVSRRTGTRKLLMDNFFSVPSPTQLALRYRSLCKLPEGCPPHCACFLPLPNLIAPLPSPTSPNCTPTKTGPLVFLGTLAKTKRM